MLLWEVCEFECVCVCGGALKYCHLFCSSLIYLKSIYFKLFINLFIIYLYILFIYIFIDFILFIYLLFIFVEAENLYVSQSGWVY